MIFVKDFSISSGVGLGSLVGNCVGKVVGVGVSLASIIGVEIDAVSTGGRVSGVLLSKARDGATSGEVAQATSPRSGMNKPNIRRIIVATVP